MGSRSKEAPGLSSCNMGEVQGWGVLGGADVVVELWVTDPQMTVASGKKVSLLS